MCLAVPGKIVEIFEEHGLRMGRIDYAGTRQVACLEYVPEALEDQYVVVHAGFAISLLDEEEARKSLALWKDLVQAAAEEGTDVFGMPLEDDNEDRQEGGNRGGNPADSEPERDR